MKKRTLTVICVLLLASVLALPALADGIIEILPGIKTVTAQDVDFGSWPYLPFDLSDRQTGGLPSVGVWTAVDESGDGLGWKIFISATDFDDGGGGGFPVTCLDATVIANLPQATIACVEGSCSSSALPISQALNAATDCLDNSAPLEMLRTNSLIENGAWEFLPYFDLKIPAQLAPGAYVSIWDVTIVTNP